MKDSPVVQRTLSSGLWASRKLAIALSRCVLPTPGGPHMKKRVVRLRGHLGDAQGRGVREPVAVAYDELLERELRVAGGCRVRGRG